MSFRNLTTPAQDAILSTHAAFTMHDVGAVHALTREELQRRMRLILEDGRVVELRAGYFEQLWTAMHAPQDLRDHAWLQFTPSGIFFATQAATVLPLVFVGEAGGGRSRASNATTVRPERMHIVVDQSGSMQTVQTAVYDGARELVEGLPEDASVAFSTFSTTVRIGPSTTRANVLSALSNAPVASGSTALYDAIVDVTSRETEGNTTIVLVTDGQDTSSSRSDCEAARRACVAFQSEATNRFLFLGSHQDAVLSAQAFGIPVGRALTFGAEEAHMRAAMRSAASNVARYRSFGADDFTHTERQASVTASHP